MAHPSGKLSTPGSLTASPGGSTGKRFTAQRFDGPRSLVEMKLRLAAGVQGRTHSPRKLPVGGEQLIDEAFAAPSAVRRVSGELPAGGLRRLQRRRRAARLWAAWRRAARR
mmetsp:Transcript_88712/g.264693  ORF Transcript_88712/g.264693 Transcript_88712/m.264693 type:complete len:111 (-) Transcript_88712:103-435(-)